jgi:ribonuclease HI
MPDRVTIYTDGGARGNPGPAAVGVVVCDAEDRVLREHREFLGEATNNEAEYRALIRGLGLAARYTRAEVRCVSDSQLLVRQMAGEYKVRDARLAELFERARERARAFEKVSFEHRPRLTGRLARADELVNEALDRAGSRRRVR